MMTLIDEFVLFGGVASCFDLATFTLSSSSLFAL